MIFHKRLRRSTDWITPANINGEYLPPTAKVCVQIAPPWPRHLPRTAHFPPHPRARFVLQAISNQPSSAAQQEMRLRVGFRLAWWTNTLRTPARQPRMPDVPPLQIPHPLPSPQTTPHKQGWRSRVGEIGKENEDVLAQKYL